MASNNTRDQNNLELNQYIPPAVDSERSPQLNKTVCRSHCGCACASSRGDGEGQSGDDGGREEHAGDTESDDLTVNGDEGVNNEIEVGDMGRHKTDVIDATLSKHNRRTCHSCRRGLPYGENYLFGGYDSLASSGFLSISSMHVECGNDDEINCMSSSMAMSMCSCSCSCRSSPNCDMSSSDYLPSMGGHFSGDTADAIHASHLYGNADPRTAMQPAVHEYPTELDMDDTSGGASGM